MSGPEIFGKNADEWTGKVEISREEIPGSKRRKDDCGLDECTHVKFKNPINGGCSYTTASSRLNCTPRSSHVRTVSSDSQ